MFNVYTLAKYHTLARCYYGNDSVQAQRSWRKLINTLETCVDTLHVMTMHEAHALVGRFGWRYYTSDNYNVQAIINAA